MAARLYVAKPVTYYSESQIEKSRDSVDMNAAVMRTGRRGRRSV